MDWYYAVQGRQVGPIPEAEFMKLVTGGVIQHDTMVWRQGLAQWIPYASSAAAAEGAAGGVAEGSAEAACTQCHRTVPRQDLLSYGGQLVCALCKPAFLQRLKEGVARPESVTYGGFWIRFLALFIDGIILWIVNTAVALPFGIGMLGTAMQKPESFGTLIGMQAIVFLLQMVISGSYQILFVGKFAATPGKMALKLRVVRPGGGPVSYGRAACRWLGTILSSLTLCIGYLIAAFDDQKRTIHDRICDTRVIRV